MPLYKLCGDVFELTMCMQTGMIASAAAEGIFSELRNYQRNIR